MLHAFMRCHSTIAYPQDMDLDDLVWTPVDAFSIGDILSVLYFAETESISIAYSRLPYIILWLSQYASKCLQGALSYIYNDCIANISLLASSTNIALLCQE